MSRRIPGLEPPAVGSVQLDPVTATAVPVSTAVASALQVALAVQRRAARPAPDGPGVDGEAVPDAPEAPDAQWIAYLDGPTRPARDRLVERYTPLVRTIAYRVAAGLPTHLDHADLVQSGVFGLIDAIERFDPQRFVRFESFAAQRIRGAILDELRAQDWVPRTVRSRLRELERAQERLERRLQRVASDHEIATEMGLPVRDVRLLTHHVQIISVEELEGAAGGVAELLAGDAPDPLAVVQATELRRQLNSAVAALAERDRTVILLYYWEGRTLAEIGRALGITESRVCQLHSRLVGRLRGRLDELATG